MGIWIKELPISQFLRQGSNLGLRFQRPSCCRLHYGGVDSVVQVAKSAQSVSSASWKRRPTARKMRMMTTTRESPIVHAASRMVSRMALAGVRRGGRVSCVMKLRFSLCG